MSNSPILQLQHAPFDHVFRQVLDFHFEDQDRLLDPTYGEGHSWRKYLEDVRLNPKRLIPIPEYEIVKDEENDGDLWHWQRLHYANMFRLVDGIFFDPPYVFDLPETVDERADDYGKYDHPFEYVRNLYEQANKIFPDLLKQHGLVLLKYTDIFSLRERKFYHCASLWPQVLDNFRVIDQYIVQHHHINPTAWQVKNRPCGVSNYTYLTIMQLSV
jgi:hypothetical protein